MYLSNPSFLTTQLYRMGQAETKKQIKRNEKGDSNSSKNSSTQQIPYWEWTNGKGHCTMRYNIVHYYQRYRNCLPEYYQSFVQVSKEQKLHLRRSIKIAKDFCLKDKILQKEVIAWYICFSDHLEYFAELSEQEKYIENEEEILQMQKDNIQKVIGSWNSEYPRALEELRRAEIRQKQPLSTTIIRSVGVFFQTKRAQQASKDVLQFILLKEYDK